MCAVQLIFSGEYTKAMEESYHKEHLACWNCDKKLIACRYIMREEHPHCVPCYQQLFAHNCEECGKPIGPDYKVGKAFFFFRGVCVLVCVRACVRA